MFKELIDKFSKNNEEEIEDEGIKLPNNLPDQVKLLKPLPGIKAGVFFTLSPDGYYAYQSNAGYAAYDWWTVVNLTDWFKPIGEEERERWFDNPEPCSPTCNHGGLCEQCGAKNE